MGMVYKINAPTASVFSIIDFMTSHISERKNIFLEVNIDSY